MLLSEVMKILERNKEDQVTLFAMLDRMLEIGFITNEECESFKGLGHLWDDISHHGSPMYACDYCNVYQSRSTDKKCHRAVYHKSNKLIEKIGKAMSRYREVKKIIEDYNVLGRLFPDL